MVASSSARTFRTPSSLAASAASARFDATATSLVSLVTSSVRSATRARSSASSFSARAVAARAASSNFSRFAIRSEVAPSCDEARSVAAVLVAAPVLSDGDLDRAAAVVPDVDAGAVSEAAAPKAGEDESFFGATGGGGLL